MFKSRLATGLAATMLLAGVTQVEAETTFTGTGTLCWLDPTGAVELPSGPTAGLVFFFKVESDDPDSRIDGWQVNHETHDLKKNGRGTIMGHLEMYPTDYDGSVFTSNYAFKNTAPSFSTYYFGSGGGLDRLVVEYEVRGGTEVNTCGLVPPAVCDGYTCIQLGPDGYGVQSTLTGTIYD
jgi:hypothetical protein